LFVTFGKFHRRPDDAQVTDPGPISLSARHLNERIQRRKASLLKFPLIRRAKRGAALAEYAVLVGLIAVASIFSIDRLGQKIADTYNDIAVELSELPGDDPTGDPTGDPEPETPTGTDPSEPTTPPSNCVVIPDDGDMHGSSSNPGASCFVHESNGYGTMFTYESVNGPIWVSGRHSEGWPFYVDSVGNTERFEIIIADPETELETTNYENFVDMRFPTLSSDDVVMHIQTEPGMFGGPDISSLFITRPTTYLSIQIRDCSIGNLTFTDRTMDHAAVEAHTGETCNKPEPFDGGGGGGDWYDKYQVLDGCITSYNEATDSTDYHWCPGPNGGEGLPADLTWAPIPPGFEYGNSNACAYDPAPEWDGYVSMFGVSQSPDPDHDSLACY